MWSALDVGFEGLAFRVLKTVFAGSHVQHHGRSSRRVVVSQTVVEGVFGLAGREGPGIGLRGPPC